MVCLCKPEDRDSVLAAAQAALATAQTAGVAADPVSIRERATDESEWRDVWKQFFRATPVGRRFTVRPSWDPGPAKVDGFVIDLDPGRAFGTGAHPSTRLVIALSEEVGDRRAPVHRFLDLGCGSGILSIAAARLWPEATGLAIDNDPEATACSQENLARNHVGTVSILTGTLDLAAGGFDLILANIQADVLAGLAGLVADRLSPEGSVILSGILADQVDEVLTAYRSAGFALSRRRDEAEWSGLLLCKADPPP